MSYRKLNLLNKEKENMVKKKTNTSILTIFFLNKNCLFLNIQIF